MQFQLEIKSSEKQNIKFHAQTSWYANWTMFSNACLL